ncbi:MAG: nucleotide exchange factor GrpE [Verrucomicrobia bacterium]|nr:nucleotide exchange factor GrpE [Verrucomicrobiota bacterium]
MTRTNTMNKPPPDADPPPEEAATSPTEALTPVEPPTLTPEQVEDLKTKAAKADENWDRLLRTMADFENFKKRAARERQEAIKFANESLLRKFIAVLDNFDMAVSAAKDVDSVESFKTGVGLIHQQFKNLLAEAGVEEIDATGKPFDPNWHEAVAQQETSELPEGQVLRQHRAGYKLRDRLIRPASVVVAKKPAN